MGFPVGYTEVFIPTLLIHTLTFLTLLKNFIFSLTHLLGFPRDVPSVDPAAFAPQFNATPLSALLLRELLPVVPIEHQSEPSRCAVCLYDLRKGDQIRRLGNCNHMFHRECIDRWMDLDHRTCPLCRTPFLTDHLLRQFNQRLLDDHADHDHNLYVDHAVFSPF